MNILRTIPILPLVLLAGSVYAQGPGNGHAGAGLLPLPVNRIVGLWDVSMTIGPCQGGPTQTFKALNTYHAGGTLTDRNTFAPGARASGQGVWSHQGNGQYKSRFQFYRFLPDGSFDGVQDIRTTMILNRLATEYTNTVRAKVLNADGSVRVELCGSGSARRVAL